VIPALQERRALPNSTALSIAMAEPGVRIQEAVTQAIRLLAGSHAGVWIVAEDFALGQTQPAWRS